MLLTYIKTGLEIWLRIFEIIKAFLKFCLCFFSFDLRSAEEFAWGKACMFLKVVLKDYIKNAL